jgi:hypothetical protein
MTPDSKPISQDERSFEILKLEYVALRAEIIQSISYQHQILLAGYGATGAFVGFVVTKGSSPGYFSALIIPPFILLGMSSLWAVECNRMVRASYYIGRILWRGLRDGAGDPRALDWECWIRSKTGAASRFRERQHKTQMRVVFWGPLFLSTLTSALSIVDAFTTPPPVPGLQPILPSILIALALIVGVLWWRIRLEIRPVSDLAVEQVPNAHNFSATGNGGS